jgi:hypothetical protein
LEVVKIMLRKNDEVGKNIIGSNYVSMQVITRLAESPLNLFKRALVVWKLSKDYVKLNEAPSGSGTWPDRYLKIYAIRNKGEFEWYVYKMILTTKYTELLYLHSSTYVLFI